MAERKEVMSFSNEVNQKAPETREQSVYYIAQIGELFKDALTIVSTRSRKYAKTDNPFANFISSAELAGTTVEQGILTRVGDKISRLKNLLERKEAGDEFADESIRDTFIDICNYFNILYQWITWGKRQFEPLGFVTQADVDNSPLAAPGTEGLSGGDEPSYAFGRPVEENGKQLRLFSEDELKAAGYDLSALRNASVKHSDASLVNSQAALAKDFHPEAAPPRKDGFFGKVAKTFNIGE